MSASLSSETGSNPFATRFIRPGAIEYLFPAGISAATLAADLERNHWRGSLMGPHGSGKSSLLMALIPELERLGRQLVRQQLQGGQRTLTWPDLNWRAWTLNTLVVIDGYEQLSLWQRLLLRARIHQRRAGLLVTAHQPVSLPLIYTTRPTPDLAQQIVRQLLTAGDERITPEDVSLACAAHPGNIRETLLCLFDLYRSRP